MNAGATAATGEVLLFLHADTHLPSDAVEVAARVLQRDDRAVLGGFVSLISVPERTFWGLSFLNSLKTHCAAVFRPKSFLLGGDE